MYMKTVCTYVPCPSLATLLLCVELQASGPAVVVSRQYSYMTGVNTKGFMHLSIVACYNPLLLSA